MLAHTENVSVFGQTNEARLPFVSYSYKRGCDKAQAYSMYSWPEEVREAQHG